MKRIIIVLVILGLFVPVASAQEPEKLHHIYLPWITNDMPRQICSRPWRLIEPEYSVNLVLNPSAELAGNFAAAGGGVVNRVTTASLYGLRSFEIVTAANGDGISLTTATLAASAHFVTLRVHGTLPPAWRVGIGGNLKAPRLIERVSQDWSLYGVAFSAGEAGGAAAVTVTQSGAGASTFNIDGLQAEPKGHWTSFCDGSQPDCRWLGTPNAATSERSAAGRTGGRPRDFQRDYGLLITEMIGAGTPPLSLDVRGYALLPGGELAGSKIEAREFTLVGTLSARSKQELHAKRQRLSQVLLGAGGQPIRLEYKGALPVKSIDCLYAGGLEGSLPVTYGNLEAIDEGWQTTRTFTERVSLQFLCADPAFYAVGEAVTVLDTNDSTTMRYCAGRLRSTGQWSNLGLAANPTANGTINAIVFNPFDGLIYFAGDFQGWGGVAGRDFIAAFDPVTGTWSTVGGASDFNLLIYALEVDAQGTLYAGGSFTDCAGNLQADYVARKPLGAGWTNLGNPAAGGAAIGTVYTIVVDRIGDIVIGGSFNNWAGIAAADMIVKWDTSAGAYVAVVAGANNPVTCVAITPKNDYFIGGVFTNWGDANGDHIVKYAGGALSSLSTGTNNTVSSLALTPTGDLYLVGFFTQVGGVTVYKAAKWNGQYFSPLGEGISVGLDAVSTMLAPDGLLFVGGGFIGLIGGWAGGIAKWNGSAWGHLDAVFPSTPIVSAIITASQDPVIPSIYDIYVGFNQTGTGYLGGLASVNTTGTADAYPKFIVTRTGGTSATLLTLRNETTGQELLFDAYELLDGETLTVNLEPTEKSIVSSLFGPVPEAILPNCDFGQWHLESGYNDVTAFVNVAGAPTITAYLLWRNAYNGAD